MTQAMTLDETRALAAAIRSQVARVVVGQDEVVEQVLVALLAGGHALLEGVPGVAKTLLVRTLAATVDLSFRRIQFTPDLMPSDVVGTSVFDPRDVSFHTRRGPLFANVVLADEINRTPPKTQAALLEAMAERQATVDGESLPLPAPFLVLATQNPVEYEGTYPLPEAQLDRFLLKVVVPYPTEADEVQILQRSLGADPGTAVSAAAQPVCSAQRLLDAQQAMAQVVVEEPVLQYVAHIVRASREWSSLALGASPRAGVALLQASRALATLRGRDFLTPDEVKQMAVPVLRHRLVLRPEAELEGTTVEMAVGHVVESVPVPR